MGDGPAAHSHSQLPDVLRATIVPGALDLPDLEEQEAAFDTQTQQLMARGLFVCGLSLALAHAAAHFVYGAIEPDSLIDALPFRGTIVVASLALALSGRAGVRRLVLPASVGLVLGSIVWLQVPVLVGGRIYVDEGALVLVLIASGLLIPYTRNQMALISIAAVSIATTTTWLADPGGEGITPLVTAGFYTAVAGFIATIGAQLTYTRRRSEFEALETAEAERRKTDRLLENILPEVIIGRLKKDEQVIADRFESATVLFADLVGFTPMSSKVSPEEVVALLNEIFTRFDQLTDRYDVEKIKTIGDAYMVAGGLPSAREGHARDIALLALDMRRVVQSIVTPTGDPLELRVGIHSGEVVAGVIGSRKFSYDLWGDVVNTASRMESHAPVGSIQLTDETHALLGDGFVLERRTGVAVKGKGEMNTWLLIRRIRD